MTGAVIRLDVVRELRAFQARVRPDTTDEAIHALSEEWIDELYARRDAGDDTAAAVLDLATREGVEDLLDDLMTEILEDPDSSESDREHARCILAERSA